MILNLPQSGDKLIGYHGTIFDIIQKNKNIMTLVAAAYGNHEQLLFENYFVQNLLSGWKLEKK